MLAMQEDDLKKELEIALQDDAATPPAALTDTEALDAILAAPENTWLKDLNDDSSLPAKYNWRLAGHNAQLAFALYCSLAAGFMYYQAGQEEQDDLETIGIVTVNLIQIFYFSLLTAEFFSTLKDNKLMGAVSGLIGTLSTISYGIAAYVFASESDNDWLKKYAWAAALLNASGTYSQNMFGVFGNINVIKKYWNSSPEATRFTLDTMRVIFKDEPDLLHMIPAHRNNLHKVVSGTLSVATGVTLMFNQMGYVCSSQDFFEKLTRDTVAGIALGIFTNLPTISMAAGITGPTLAQLVVDKIFDLCQEAADRIAQKSSVKRSKRELAYDISTALLITVTSFLATKSSASSRILYNSKCPSYFKNPFIQIDTDQGAMLFNAVMTAIALNAGMKYAKVAYAPDNSTEKAKHRVAAIVSKIQHLKKDDSEALALSLKWKKPAERSCLSRLFKPKPAADSYALLDIDGAPQMEKRISR
jgi:hypothetical protein